LAEALGEGIKMASKISNPIPAASEKLSAEILSQKPKDLTQPKEWQTLSDSTPQPKVQPS